jgi:hypothetical protein
VMGVLVWWLCGERIAGAATFDQSRPQISQTLEDEGTGRRKSQALYGAPERGKDCCILIGYVIAQCLWEPDRSWTQL